MQLGNYLCRERDCPRVGHAIDDGVRISSRLLRTQNRSDVSQFETQISQYCATLGKRATAAIHLDPETTGIRVTQCRVL